MSKSEYYQNIDLYLDGELSGVELEEFNNGMRIHAGLAEEVEFHREVEEAVQEKEIMNLRKKLGRIILEEQSLEDDLMEEILSEYDGYNFGLSNEFSSLREFFGPLASSEIDRLSHSLPRIHIFQHEVAAKENIHQFYKEQFDKEESEEELLSPNDETIFSEIKSALHENDINELRANLVQIAHGLPEHQWNTEDIDKYLNLELAPPELENFEEELKFNRWLEVDLEFHREVDTALMEKDILDLRASLDKIQGIEHTGIMQSEEIDRYLNEDLNVEEFALFEEELSTNPALAAEVAFYQEVDVALEEKAIMQLRSALEEIGENTRKENQRAIRMPLSKLAISTVAASLIILLGIGGLLTQQTTSEKNLYTKYYQPYQGAGTIRSDNTTLDQTLTVALQKFNAQEYESALGLFQTVIANDTDNPVGHFYAGVSYQETGRFIEAIEEYSVVVKNRDNLFVEQAEWYIGLCYLQTQDRKRAYRQMELIAKSDSYYKPKAEAILRKIKSRE